MYRKLKKEMSASPTQSSSGTLQQKIDNYIRHRKHVLMLIQEEKSKVEKSVNEFYNEMVSRLHSLKEATILDFRERYQVVKDDCRDDIAASTEISKAINLLNSTSGTVAVENESNDLKNRKMSDYEQVVSNIVDKNRHVEFIYPEETKLREALDEIEHLGVVKIFDYDSPLFTEAFVQSVPDDIINLSSKICFVNETLYTINDSSELLASRRNSVKTVSPSVNGVCQFDNNTVCFTERGQKLLSVLDGRTRKRTQIEMDGEGHGLAKCLDNTVITFPTEEPPRVEIVNPDGKTVLLISHYPDGRQFFQNPLYVAASNKGDIIVCDPRPNGTRSNYVGGVCITHDDGTVETIRSFQNLGTHVFYFNSNGEKQWTRFLTGVSEISGVCSGDKRKIYVCGVKPRCVFQLNDHGMIRALYPYPEDKIVVGICENDESVVCKSVSDNKLFVLKKDPWTYSK